MSGPRPNPALLSSTIPYKLKTLNRSSKTKKLMQSPGSEEWRSWPSWGRLSPTSAHGNWSSIKLQPPRRMLLLMEFLWGRRLSPSTCRLKNKRQKSNQSRLRGSPAGKTAELSLPCRNSLLLLTELGPLKPHPNWAGSARTNSSLTLPREIAKCRKPIPMEAVTNWPFLVKPSPKNNSALKTSNWVHARDKGGSVRSSPLSTRRPASCWQ